ncbi:MAG: isoleucine--tRNA ligase, partial [Dehalococcoidia bacterium]
MFEPVSSRVNFPELEKRIFSFWREKRIFERSVEERKEAPLFVLYEGPPTANASPGVHHVLSRVFKDVIPRYKTMKGYCAPRKAGWDTHGLPVELEVERELGFSSKADIEAYGVSQFNARCRESVFRYLKEWEELTERIGFWLDMEHPYITLENGYVESCWWVIKQLWDKGLIYQGYKVTPHCPRCGTSLSSPEVALGYEEAEDPSVWVKFKIDLTQPGGGEAARSLLTSDVPTYLLAWTTTPWTLPADVALAVAPDAQYAIVQAGGERLILAQALIYQAIEGEYEVTDTILGSDLAGLRYEPLYQRHIIYGELDEHGYRVLTGDFVSLNEGTGIVHIAPAYGEIDMDVGNREGLPFIHVVDLRGHVVSGVSGTGANATMEDVRRYYENLGSDYREIKLPGDGLFVKDADPLIIEDLEARGLLYRSGRIRHTYPFCWRCDTPLLYYAKPSWYIRTTARKDRLIAGNEEINWYPEHIKRGRFGDWLENNVDWAFSRERYWGTPLPIWRCDLCGDYNCIGSVEELKGKPGLAGLEDSLDLHRPFVDGVTFACPKCQGRMRRLPEVLDAWFDSGAMPVAQWHYPFENRELFAAFFPADYICEAVDQTRGWFYTLHALSTLLFDRPCFRNVICLGHILDAKGEKMSKSKGNVVDPWTILDNHGADALRWYLLTSSPAGSVRRFSMDLVGEALRRFLLTLWNTYSFFVTYANIDKFDPHSVVDVTYESELDRWILSELNLLIDEVTRAMEGYNPTDAGRRIQRFVEDLSNWYVRRSRRRFWKSESDADKLAAYTSLYHCLVTLAKLLAPLTPFVAEDIYQNLVRSSFPEEAESVHLADYPVADLAKVDEQLAQDTRRASNVASTGRWARSLL